MHLRYPLFEIVILESNEHVAEAVGENFHKITTIQLKTNTRIITPKVNQTPCIKICGYDLAAIEEAKTTILEAAKNFDDVKARKKDIPTDVINFL